MKKALLFGVLAVVLLFGVIAVASAESVAYPGSGNPRSATGTVNVKATVNPKVSLTIVTTDTVDSQTVNFGSLDPGTYSGWSVGLTVDSNKSFTLSGTESFANFTAQGIKITRSGATDTNWVGHPKGQNISFADDYSIDIPWTADPGAYTGSVQYTVTQ